MSLLANEFEVLSELYVQVILAAEILIYVFYEIMNGCKNIKTCFENVNIHFMKSVMCFGNLAAGVVHMRLHFCRCLCA